jgi:hypothetical protein
MAKKARSGLKVHENGFIEISSEEAATEALSRFRNLKAEIEEVRKESGLADLEKDAVAYSAAVRDFMIKHALDQLQGDGFHGTLVKGFMEARWVTDERDLSGDEPAYVETLQVLIERKCKSKISKPGSKARKLWLSLTRRVADPQLIEDAVGRGDVVVDEISAAWYERPRQPYLRVYED